MSISRPIATTRKELFPRVLFLVFFLAGLGVLFFFNPQQHAFYPFCLFHRMTGLLCPGCGSLRAVHELLHGDLVGALRYNPLLVASLPLAGFLFWRSLGLPTRSEAAGPDSSSRWIWVALGVLLLFGVVRNLPFFKHTFGMI
jgi:hypothetical protein